MHARRNCQILQTHMSGSHHEKELISITLLRSPVVLVLESDRDGSCFVRFKIIFRGCEGASCCTPACNGIYCREERNERVLA